MLPGRAYAFNVTAMDVQGRDLFKNGGTSETYSFTYGDDCSAPQGIVAKSLPKGFELRWNSQAIHSGYDVWYQIEDHPVEYLARVNQPLYRNFDMPEQRRIIYKVKAYCGLYKSEFSDTASVVTDKVRRGF
jgi:hypothetical protein